MRNRKWSPYFWKIAWFIGFVVLVNFSFSVKKFLQQMASETFNAIPYLYSSIFISIIFGIYLALLFVQKWSFHVNMSLMICVCIPFLLLTFSSPILTILASFDLLPANFMLSAKFFDIYATYTFGIIAGLTLILSLFSSRFN